TITSFNQLSLYQYNYNCMSNFCYILITSVDCNIFFFFFNHSASTEIYTLSLHDALPISAGAALLPAGKSISSDMIGGLLIAAGPDRKKHTSELQSPYDLVCRLLLEKKKNKEETYRHSLNHGLSVVA